MSTSALRRQLAIFVVTLAGALCAQPAQALDVRASNVRIYDAETKDPTTKLVLGRKLLVRCDYEYDGTYSAIPSWQIQLQVDGKTIGTYTAEPPEAPPSSPIVWPKTGTSGITKKPLPVEGFVTPTTAGQHTAKCVLDAAGKLKGVDSNPLNNTSSASFAVDVGTVAVAGKGQTGFAAAGSSAPIVPPQAKGGFAPGGVAAQASTPMLAGVPELKFALKAQVLPNCGPGQDVIAITGTLSNIGSGPAVIPPGTPVIKIDAAVGVHGASISSGNILSGQSVPVSGHLKPKALPASLAGATLKLVATDSSGIKQLNPPGWKHQDLDVVFPANFCKSPPPATTGRTVAPTGRSGAK